MATFKMMALHPSIKEWIAWALRQKAHPKVRRYIEKRTTRKKK